MFERYTEKARRVIFWARYETSQFGAHEISTEHLLLGLMREDAKLMSRLAPTISNEGVRKEIEAASPPGKRVSTSVDLPLDRAAKRVLGYAAEEAERLHHRYIGTEHLLLGLLREKDCLAAKILDRNDLTLDKARALAAKSKHVPSERPLEETPAPWATREIQGEPWDTGYLALAAEACRKFLWTKREYQPRDALMDPVSKRVKLHTGEDFDSAKFEFVKDGWMEGHCAICWWPLFQTPEPDHGVGFTNGQDWLCLECYEKVVNPQVDFE